MCDDEGVEVSVDFKRPLSIDTKAEVAWQMHQAKKYHEEIGKELDCCGSYVTKLLKFYAEKHNIEWIDGRSLRLQFPHKNRKPGLFKQLVDRVMAMYFKDVPLGEIAVACDVHVATVRKTRNWYFEEQGLPVPNGRTRAGQIKRDRNRDKGSS